MSSEADTPLLRVRGLTKSYGDRMGCRDVTFDLWQGEILGVVGESGSGKTTLLNLLSGSMEPSAGTVQYLDRNDGLIDIYGVAEDRKSVV